MFYLNFQISILCLWVIENIFDGIDHTAGNPNFVEFLDPFLCLPLGKGFVEYFGQSLSIRHAILVR